MISSAFFICLYVVVVVVVCFILFCFWINFSALGFPGCSDSKESAHNEGDLDLISGLGRSPGEWNGNPLQYSCLEDPMDRGGSHGQGRIPWTEHCRRTPTVHGVTESDMNERDSLFSFRISVWFRFKVLTFLVNHTFCSLISLLCH